MKKTCQIHLLKFAKANMWELVQQNHLELEKNLTQEMVRIAVMPAMIKYY